MAARRRRGSERGGEERAVSTGAQRPSRTASSPPGRVAGRAGACDGTCGQHLGGRHVRSARGHSGRAVTILLYSKRVCVTREFHAIEEAPPL